MEIHHQSHAAREKWTHYLFEFLMLFLAVFCGFLAENQREHIIEKKRASELAKSLYLEIFSDSIKAQENFITRLQKEESLEYIQAYFKDSNLTSLPKEFYPHFTWAFLLSNSIAFEPKDGMLNQLINSGALRYFKNTELQKIMGQLTVDINGIRTRNEQEYTFMADYIRPFMIQHFDYQWLSTVSNKGSIKYKDALEKYRTRNNVIYSELYDANKINRKETSNLAAYYLIMLRSTRARQLVDYIKTNHLLLESLRKNYKVD